MVRAKNKKKAPLPVFIASTVVIFFLSLSAADSVGFVPSYIDGSTPLPAEISDTAEVSIADLPQLGESNVVRARTAYPERITINSVDINLPVQNPATTNVDKLDALLQNGPARYAPSALLGEKGNIVIFAHSSHVPVVHNKMYKAFNNIPNVVKGATIIITGSDGKEYVYSVDSVVQADTNDGVKIPLVVANTPKLTLVTCDTLTGKSARYILTASFIGTN